MFYLNENLKNLNRIFDQHERKNFLRLDLNENPTGLPDEVIKNALKKVDKTMISQYPETLAFTELLAKHNGCNIENLCLTNGSSEAIRYIIQAFTSENGKIVGVVPSYFMFQIYSEMYNRNFVGINYQNDLEMPIDSITSALTDDTELLILLNPNNPMGNVYSEEEFERMLKVCKEKQITVMIDEAYHYFYPKTFIKHALNNRRVLVTRTFSKLFSLAGCRLGYVCGHPEDIKYIQKLCTPHNVNAFGILFATEILSNPEVLENLIKDFNAGRKYLVEELNKMSYSYYGEYGNFIFIKPKTNAEKLVSRMKTEKNILIKKYANVGMLGDCLRVSIGNKEVMKIFMDSLKELDK